ncbi:MAG: hypothetical protein CMB80_20750 [Flammeovirgaceae bacterium]|nr:hypothetical protein [Flammeovirgaceae bacterium]MBE63723.1 hypothetical protein [Flammeovirgaceae bacterium]MBR07097.1 hypothetical protein [Rickettsiales bacterium]
MDSKTIVLKILSIQKRKLSAIKISRLTEGRMNYDQTVKTLSELREEHFVQSTVNGNFIISGKGRDYLESFLLNSNLDKTVIRADNINPPDIPSKKIDIFSFWSKLSHDTKVSIIISTVVTIILAIIGFLL